MPNRSLTAKFLNALSQNETLSLVYVLDTFLETLAPSGGSDRTFIGDTAMKKQFISLLLIGFFLSSQAQAADGCSALARESKTQGISHLIISFEGLASYWAGFVRRSLLRNLQSQFAGEFASKNYSYTSSAAAAACISDWKKVWGDRAQFTVIGHSFGGGIAVFDLLKRVPQVTISHVITLDPRSWTADSLYAKNKNLKQFTLPDNVVSGFNFYQRKAMPGYQVEGAKNIQLVGPSHTKVPAHAEVFNVVSCEVFGDCD